MKQKFTDYVNEAFDLVRKHVIETHRVSSISVHVSDECCMVTVFKANENKSFLLYPENIEKLVNAKNERVFAALNDYIVRV